MKTAACLKRIDLCRRSTTAALDISGFAEIPETPGQPVTLTPASTRVLKRPPLEGEFINVTDSLGNRVYLRQKEETGIKVIHTSLTLLWYKLSLSTACQDLICVVLIFYFLCPALKNVDSRIVPNTEGELGLLTLPIRVLRQQEAERVSVEICLDNGWESEQKI